MVQSLENIEDFVVIFGWNTQAIIGYSNNNLFRFDLTRDDDMWFKIGPMINYGIFYYICENLRHQKRIGLQRT